jgi:hypothetical protein
MASNCPLTRLGTNDLYRGAIYRSHASLLELIATLFPNGIADRPGRNSLTGPRGTTVKRVDDDSAIKPPQIVPRSADPDVGNDIKPALSHLIIDPRLGDPQTKSTPVRQNGDHILFDRSRYWPGTPA